MSTIESNIPYQLSTMEIIATFILNALASFIISLGLLTLLIKTNVIKWRLLHDALNFVINPSRYEDARRKRRNSIMQTQKQIELIEESVIFDDDGIDGELRIGIEEELPDFAKRNARVSRQIQFGGVREATNDLDKTSRPTKIKEWNISNRPSENFYM